MAFMTAVQMKKQREHTVNCMNAASANALNMLLSEIEREDYTKIDDVKESIKGFLKLYQEHGKGVDDVKT